MRSLLLLALPLGVLAQSEPLTYDAILAKARRDPALLRVVADHAARERELAATGGLLLSGPTLGVETGPRRIDGVSGGTDLRVQVDAPLFFHPGLRRTAGAAVEKEKQFLLASLPVEQRFELREAYLDAWLAQTLLALHRTQLETAREWLDIARARVRGGADPAYQVDLAQGDTVRAQSELDEVTRKYHDSWARLRVLSEVPESPAGLADPAPPVFPPLTGLDEKYMTGVLRRSVLQRAEAENAEFRLHQSVKGARWGVRGSYAREGVDRAVGVGLVYRFGRFGEGAALQRENDTGLAAIRGENEVERETLDARFRAARARLAAFGTLPEARDFLEAARAVGLRLREGKERPSDAIPIRRQLAEAEEARQQRLHDAHQLIAEIELLTAGETP